MTAQAPAPAQAPALSPDAARRADLLRRFFVSREDRIAILDTSGPEPFPRPIDGGKYIDALIAAHVAGPDAQEALISYTTRRGGARSVSKGRPRIGFYTPDDAENTRWGCLDFDDHNRPTDIENPLDAALRAQESAQALGLPTYLERSGGGHGWHIWLFAAAPVPAAVMRAIMISLIPDDLYRKDGTRAPRTGAGVEVFPKQAAHKGKKRTGNMVWAPWFHAAPEGANQFYRAAPSADGCRNIYLEKTGAECAYIPAFDAVSPERLQDIATELKHNKTPATPAAAANAATAAPAQTPDASARQTPASALPLAQRSYSEELDAIRSALDSLDPDMAYDDWVAVGAAIHSFDSGPAGCSIFESWCSMGAKYKPGEPAIKWASFTEPPPPPPPGSPPDGYVRLGTLYAMAKTRGWTVPPPERMHRARKGEAPSEAPIVNNPSVSSGFSQKPAGGRGPVREHHPEIVINNRQDREIVRDAWGILLSRNERALLEAATDAAVAELPKGSCSTSANPGATRHVMVPPLFQRGGALTRLVWRPDAAGEPVLVLDRLGENQTLSLLTTAADWVKTSETTGVLHVRPPATIVKIMHSDLEHSGGGRLPLIDAVAHSPILDSDGRLISAPGHHPHARLWMAPSPDLRAMPKIPTAPTVDQIEEARAFILDDLLVDFPFAGEAERANAVALLLLPFVRRAIHGPTPLHMIESPTPGTGKTLLADVISIVSTGRKAEPLTLGRDDAEIEKRIVSVLLRGRPIVLFDNITHALDSGSLASAITSYPAYTGRRLSASEIIELPNTVAWIATANNPRMSMEVARRCARIRIDAPAEHPWERVRFKHAPLTSWVLENRARIVHACLTLIRAWQAAGSPRSDRQLGSFDDWSQTIGGILDVVGIPDFLANQKELYDAVDDQTGELKELVAAWWEERSVYETSAKDLNDICEAHSLMVFQRGDGGPKSQQQKLGHTLKRVRDRIIDGRKIVLERNNHTKCMNYRLVEVQTFDQYASPDDPPEGPQDARPQGPPQAPQEASKFALERPAGVCKHSELSSSAGALNLDIRNFKSGKKN